MPTSTKIYDIAILGGGAAGYTAAMYARRYGLTVVVFDAAFGGYTALAGTIENYPGARNVRGDELMRTMRQQAVDDLGAEHYERTVIALSGAYHCFTVAYDDGGVGTGTAAIQAKTLIIATGMEHRTLNLPREASLMQRGVHLCPTCDGPVYREKRVAMVGGGDSAVKGTVQLVDMGAEHVYLIAREDSIELAEPINQERLHERVAAGKATLLLGTEVREYLGGPPLEGVALSKPFHGSDRLAVAAVFLAIGAIPRSALAASLGVRLNEKGEIDVEPESMTTNVDGVFAAGDVCDASWGFKQTVTAAAQGAIAATSVYRDCGEHRGACAMHAIAIPRNILPMVR